MNKQVQLTKTGLEQLQKELSELNDVKRPQVVDRLARARGEGDLSENSDYIAAREELEFLDGRIEELSNVISNATLVSVNPGDGGVNIGTKVTVGVNGSKVMFTIVGEWEADPAERKISPDSPLGQSLMGKRVGDKVQVAAPAGNVVYDILAIA